ncbi:MAG: RNA 3'-terminal phosphate cyclase [DPANN group archaeon]|nr:RNA 3'-terminal phosphate cyclase [DPANN group archaeon]
MNQKMIIIDGSKGEGGGQVIRSAVALSAVTQKPVKIINIRAKRCNPGLRNQHVNGIKAVGEICNAKIEGCYIGSSELEFIPSSIQPKYIKIKIDTAGSISLILQAIMIPLLHAKSNIIIEIKGGATFGKWAPPIDYTTQILFQLLKKMGYYLKLDIIKQGYYPKGMADVVLKVTKTEKLKPLVITDRGKLLEIKGVSNASSLLKKAEVAERQKIAAKKYLEDKFKVPVNITIEYADTDSVGSCIVLCAVFENTLLGSDALGERGVKAETVGITAAKCIEHIINTDCTIDPLLSDQILPYLVFAEGKSKIKISKVTGHLETIKDVIGMFIERKICFEDGFVYIN